MRPAELSCWTSLTHSSSPGALHIQPCVQVLVTGLSPLCPLCRPGQRMWLPSHSQHEQRCPSLTLVSTALLTTVSLPATYFNSSWHFLSSKHIENLKSACRMVPGGAASIHMLCRFPACPSEFPTLLSPRLRACSLQCLEIPQICPAFLSLSVLGHVFIHRESCLDSLPKPCWDGGG